MIKICDYVKTIKGERIALTDTMCSFKEVQEKLQQLEDSVCSLYDIETSKQINSFIEQIFYEVEK